MKNERGEATLFCVLILVALSGLLTLCSLELQHAFTKLQKRTNLFLCVKETKGELNLYVTRMGRLNWIIKNTSRAQIIALLFPPLWPHIGNAQKLKKIAKTLQVMSTAPYFTKLAKLKRRGCPIDPQMLLTPYILGSDFGFKRTLEGAAKQRKSKWTYYFFSKPYLLTLNVDLSQNEALNPEPLYQAKEKMGILSSHLSSL